MKKTIVACFSLACVTVMEIYALHKGIDGQIFSVVVGVIGTIVGYVFGKGTD